jgi:hypothetical protein
MVHEATVETRRQLKNMELTDSIPDNVKHFLDTPSKEWFLTCGELCVSNGGNTTVGLWSEDKHQDGGMSVLHMGLTLFGRRRLVLEQGAGTAADAFFERFLTQHSDCYRNLAHGPALRV